MLWPLMLSVLLYFLYRNISSSYLHWKKLGVKCWKPTFFFGDLWGPTIGKESFPEMVKRQYEDFKNERFYGGYNMMTPGLYIKDPDLIREVTIKDFDHFTDHIRIAGADPLWHISLINLKGEDWRKMRSTLSPTFTSSKMKILFELMVECAEKLVSHFSENQAGLQEVELKDTFSRYANDVIATCAFGVEFDSLRQKNNKFYKNGVILSDFRGLVITIKLALFSVCPKLLNLLGVSIIAKPVMDYFRNIILDTIKTREDHNIVRKDMLHLLLEVKKGRLVHEHETGIYTEDTGFATAKESDVINDVKQQRAKLTLTDIEAQALIFYFAGFDTVSRALSFAGYEIAINPDVQNRLRQEIKHTLTKCNGKFSYEALNKMKYLDMVISESLRKWPPTVITDRICTSPYTLPTKPFEPIVRLKKDDQVLIPIFAIHRDPEYFPNPDKFDPERFSDENRDRIVPYTYIPFGIGPRNCIASRFALVEAKVLFVHLLSKFELVPIQKTQIPIQINKTNRNIIAEKGYWIGFKPISL